MSWFRKGSIVSLAVALAATGCGGGSGSGGGQGGSAPQVTVAGNAVVTYFGTPKPMQTASSGQVSVFGESGATFSTVTLEPPHNLDDTYLLYSRVPIAPTPILYKLPNNSNVEQLLYQSASGAFYPNASPAGQIAFNQSGMSTAHTVLPDGTDYKTLSFSTSPNYYPAYSNNSKIAYTDLTGNLYVAPATGGTATKIQTNEATSNTYNNQTVAWNHGATEIAYSVLSGGQTDIFETPATGGTAVNITPVGLQGAGNYLSNPTWNADGVTLAAIFVASGASVSQVVKFSTLTSEYVTVTPSGDSDTGVCFSPDGVKMAFHRSSTNGQTPGIYMADAGGGDVHMVLPDPSTEQNSILGPMVWSPFLPNETVVATSGSTFYDQACTGFLLSQNGDQFGSLVAFTATTPTGTTIQAPTQTSGSAPLIFSVSATALTHIGYMNTYFGSGTIIPLSSVTSVVVSIDANTGQVDIVAPAAKAAPATRKANGSVTYAGRFKAIYDGTGRNLAPSGAGQLTLNHAGKLVSFK